MARSATAIAGMGRGGQTAMAGHPTMA